MNKMSANSIDREFSSKQWTEQWRQTNQTAGEEIEGRGIFKDGVVVKVYIFSIFQCLFFNSSWTSSDTYLTITDKWGEKKKDTA